MGSGYGSGVGGGGGGFGLNPFAGVVGGTLALALPVVPVALGTDEVTDGTAPTPTPGAVPWGTPVPPLGVPPAGSPVDPPVGFDMALSFNLLS